ncbi:O-antigen ligase family protein [Planctellipticum variicoloris]|uniref:O-antigen ligase family protein n=1 Tax=Planctellipticum variicoloris TaxID=3064265 RepID=UPI003013E2DA|nr:O-antigen ligase family protein [Planctomycetaceae bacterium SH412]
MSAQPPSHSHRRRRHSSSRQPQSVSTGFGNAGSASTPWTFSRFQSAAASAFVLVIAMIWGGRTPVGQMALVVGALALSASWLVGLWRRSAPVWIPAPGLGLGLAGGLVLLLQILPLPASWLTVISPAQAEVLPLWSAESGARLGLAAWNCISFAPGETRSSLVIYGACLAVFATTVQGLRTSDDVFRLLRLAAGISLGMAAFGVLQYATANRKFYWIFENPDLSTTYYATGSFFNRNHFAQFVVLGIGPAIAWLAMQFKHRERTGREALPPAASPLPLALLGSALAIGVLAVLLSLSRAGTVSMLIAVVVASVGLIRCGWIPIRTGLALAAVTGVVCGVFSLTSSELLGSRFALLDENGRYAIWQTNLAVAERFPWFGTGAGTHVDAHYLELEPRSDGREFVHAESSLLEVASETGLAGASIGAVALLTCLWWCAVVLRRGESEARAAACGILASLLATAAHAAVDFVWHTPACLLMVVLLAAAACRLYTLTALPLRNRPCERPLSRRWTLAAAPLLLMAGGFMVHQLLPAVQAAPPWTQYLAATFHGPEGELSEVEAQELWRQRLRLAHRAARTNRLHPRSQETVATFYLRLFDLKQAAAGRSHTFSRLRTACEGSDFTSAAEVRDWVAEQAGPNARLLDLTWQTTLGAVRTAPLRGEAYLTLAQLAFLHDPSGALKADLLNQALAVRPNDGRVRFFLGREALLAGDMPLALEHWKIAFRGGEARQREIAELLAGQFPAQFFLDEFQPDEPALRVLAEVFEQKRRGSERDRILEVAAERAAELARAATTAIVETHWLHAVEARRQLGDQDLLESALREALESCPQNFRFHRLLGELLLQREDFDGAAEELQWCATRQTDNAQVRALAAAALKNSYRQPAGETERPIRLTSGPPGAAPE